MKHAVVLAHANREVAALGQRTARVAMRDNPAVYRQLGL